MSESNVTEIKPGITQTPKGNVSVVQQIVPDTFSLCLKYPQVAIGFASAFHPMEDGTLDDGFHTTSVLRLPAPFARYMATEILKHLDAAEADIKAKQEAARTLAATAATAQIPSAESTGEVK